MEAVIKGVGLVAAVVLPFWNLPLIFNIQRRRSSRDISLSWAWGVFGCLILMLPSALTSVDIVFKVFSLVNVLLFSGVVIQVARYR
ncbi:MAG: hypothetical protein HYZ93_05495 [Candidatus Omnitrophica bacterium]|nr:hypothetical protein [Candidatus Omnitrophota bacterium]